MYEQRFCGSYVKLLRFAASASVVVESSELASCKTSSNYSFWTVGRRYASEA